MRPKISEKEWLEDFSDFVASEGAPVPQDLSQKILSYVHRELNPSAWFVFGKLMGIHTAGTLISLSICDQFGVKLFDNGISLADYFMRWGHSVCMTLCGFVFIGLSMALAMFVLKNEELTVLKKNFWVQIPSLSLLSLAALIGFGAEVVVSLGLLWLFGALSGGFVPLIAVTATSARKSHASRR